jgi:lipopolysaccharide transport system ATP-binding protein
LFKPAVELRNVSKSYSRSPTRTFLHTYLKDWFRESESDSFHALKNISFSLESGESLGIVGPNGAGKTTLLGLVAGISYPEEGSLAVNGTVAALLELGSGFHPDLTGEENVFLNASLLGLSRKTTSERFGEIVEFSGISDFIHEPLRTYSTGMVMRLAFSVAVNVDPDILIVDEAFAVGDQEFQSKCFDKIFQFKQAGKTLVCVSHSLITLRRLCDRALWLDHGEEVMLGAAAEVLDSYQSGVRTRAVPAK